jgi:hypothetical protein
MRHKLELVHMTTDRAFNIEMKWLLYMYLSFSYEVVISIIISRDIFAIFFLFCTKDKLFDPDILSNCWLQLVDKMIKVSLQSAVV